MLPYIYTLFLHANVSGEPVMRPLWYEFPDTPEIAAEDKVFMLGPSLAVAPVLRQGESTVRVVLPKGTAGNGVWYDADDGTAVAGTGKSKVIEFNATAPLDTIKHYLRGGTMLPLKERPRRSSSAMARDPITLVIALDAKGGAEGDLYLDDGKSYAFQRGQYTYRSFRYSTDGTLTARGGVLPPNAGLPVSDSGYESGVLIDKIVVLGLPGGPEGWGVEALGGEPLEAAPGPLMLRLGRPEVALVVRRAQLDAGGDWTLKFSKTKGGAKATS